MTWTITCNDASGMIELVFTGNVTGPEIREATSWSISLMKNRNIKDILFDTTDQEQVPSIFDIYNLPDQYEKEGLTRQSRVGLVLPQKRDLRAQARFYEDVCVNRGWTVRLFENREDAVRWLRGGDVKESDCVAPPVAD